MYHDAPEHCCGHNSLTNPSLCTNDTTDLFGHCVLQCLTICHAYCTSMMQTLSLNLAKWIIEHHPTLWHNESNMLYSAIVDLNVGFAWPNLNLVHIILSIVRITLHAFNVTYPGVPQV